MEAERKNKREKNIFASVQKSPIKKDGFKQNVRHVYINCIHFLKVIAKPSVKCVHLN